MRLRDWSLFGLMGLLLLVLCACGTRVEEPEPANRVAAEAWREWRRFDAGTIHHPGNGVPGRPMRVGTTETREPARSRIGEYWNLAGRKGWDGSDTDKPWSAAFVSWVMARAGVPARDFPHAGRHAEYLLAIDDAQGRGGSPAFVLRDPDRYRAKPGDLLCRGTGGNVMRLADAYRRREAIDRFVQHCEIAISVRAPYLRTIGGNVQDSVMLVAYPLDSDSRPIALGGSGWMLIVENRRY